MSPVPGGAAPKLSIALPVYNVADFLGATLDSILPQATDEDVEVVVVDGASTDATAEVVASRASPRLRYVRLDKRGGIDADMSTTVEHARGEYCWLFSGDDIMQPDAIARVRTWLEEKHDLYVFKHDECDKTFSRWAPYPIFADDTTRRLNLGDSPARVQCFSTALNTEALFSFMSGLVVRREKWLSVPMPTAFVGSCWAHVARFLTIARESGLRVCYAAETVLERRGDNDSFITRGLTHRVALSIDGFVRLGETFFGASSLEMNAVLRMLRGDLPPILFFLIRDLAHENPGRENLQELRRLFDVCYGRAPGWKNRVWRWIFRAPPGVFHLAQWAYRTLVPDVFRSRLVVAGSRRFHERNAASLAPGVATSAPSAGLEDGSTVL